MNNLARSMFPDKAELYDKGLCTDCKYRVQIAEFKDEKSRKEYHLSGMCQKCQDKFFTTN